MLEHIQKFYKSHLLEWNGPDPHDPSFVLVKLGSLRIFLEAIRKDPLLNLNSLDLFSVIPMEDRVGLTYFLRSSQNAHWSLRVKAFGSTEECAELETVSDLWPNARCFEHEWSVLLGIRFRGLAPSKIFSPVLMREKPFAEISSAGGME